MDAIYPEAAVCPYTQTGGGALRLLHLLELSRRGRFWSTKLLLLGNISSSIINSSYMYSEQNKGYIVLLKENHTHV